MTCSAQAQLDKFKQTRCIHPPANLIFEEGSSVLNNCDSNLVYELAEFLEFRPEDGLRIGFEQTGTITPEINLTRYEVVKKYLTYLGMAERSIRYDASLKEDSTHNLNQMLFYLDDSINYCPKHNPSYITFNTNSSDLTFCALSELRKLATFMMENDRLKIEIRTYLSDGVSKELCELRFSAMLDFFASRKLERTRFEHKIFDPSSQNKVKQLYTTDSKIPEYNRVTFLVLDDMVEDTCQQFSSGVVVNFKKGSNQPHESECDSLSDIFEYIMQDDSTVYAIIGIAKNKSKKEKGIGMARSKIVIDKLIAMGVPENRLESYVDVYLEPKEGAPRDWPYYPLERSYEIGAHLQLAP